MALWFWIGVAFVSWGLASFFGKLVAPYFRRPLSRLDSERHHRLHALAAGVGPAPQLNLDHANLADLGARRARHGVHGQRRHRLLQRLAPRGRFIGHTRQRHLSRADGDTGGNLPGRTDHVHTGDGNLLRRAGHRVPDAVGAGHRNAQSWKAVAPSLRESRSPVSLSGELKLASSPQCGRIRAFRLNGGQLDTAYSYCSAGACPPPFPTNGVHKTTHASPSGTGH